LLFLKCGERRGESKEREREIERERERERELWDEGVRK
jgi:hypothetical protein